MTTTTQDPRTERELAESPDTSFGLLRVEAEIWPPIQHGEKSGRFVQVEIGTESLDKLDGLVFIGTPCGTLEIPRGQLRSIVDAISHCTTRFESLLERMQPPSA